MPFNAEQFAQADTQLRTKTIEVPELAQWFGEDEAAVWRVRGLNGNELAYANNAMDRWEREDTMIEALASQDKDKIASAIKETLGRSGAAEVQPEMAKRMEYLVAGSVEPACDLSTASLLFERFPVKFLELTNAILALTGQGVEVKKKPIDSGTTKESA